VAKRDDRLTTNALDLSAKQLHVLIAGNPIRIGGHDLKRECCGTDCSTSTISAGQRQLLLQVVARVIGSSRRDRVVVVHLG
jgi:hypothetical protein